MSSIRSRRFTDTDSAPPIRVSFEFFPPKTAEMEKTLWEAIARLAPLQPNFVSVTYGAATRPEVDAVIEAYAQAGVRHVVALRGDPVGGIGERFAPHPAGYRNA